MSQPEELVILPHFKPEEVEALRVEHERRAQVFQGQALLSDDDERIRDAVQRESFWRQQSANDHTREEIAHCIFVQGRIDEALEIAKNPERRAYYEPIHAAIMKDDEEECDCTHMVSKKMSISDAGEQVVQVEENLPAHVVGKFPSAKHGGRMVPIKVCPECKEMNIG